MIEIKDLKKSYNGIQVLNGISFNIEKGEVLAIIGPSGTGKSTLLRCINYLENPEQGELHINNLKVDFSNINKQEILDLRKMSSMVFQNYNLFANKTVLENVSEALIVVKEMKKK